MSESKLIEIRFCEKCGAIISSEAMQRKTDRGFVVYRYMGDPVRAAAPQLLEALLNIENDDGSIPAPIWEMRNKAIAKAMGENQ